MICAHSSAGRGLPFQATLFSLTFLAFGCTDASGVGKTFPVSGKVMLNNEPLTAETTTVLFVPDAARGNTSSLEAAGTVDEQGTYTLFTRGKKGALPGWYKVVVTATELSTASSKTPLRHRPVPKSLVPGKYGLAKTTDLAVEVVERPAAGAYDLKLKR
jgi:hypothetical protein